MSTYHIQHLELVLALTHVADLVSPAVANHHKRVAYITSSLATELGLPVKEREQVVVAAALHDLGAFSLQERLDTLEFEVLHPHRHAELGYRLLSGMPQSDGVARIVRSHHVPWDYGRGSIFEGRRVSHLSHLIHLADRIDVLINPKGNVLHQANEITERILESRGSVFIPEYVDAFRSVAGREYFWLDTISMELNKVLRSNLSLSVLELEPSNVIDLAKLLSHLIDFKSPFTSTHTSGVAACAAHMAQLSGFDKEDCQRIRIAGYLHDLGKLAVPTEILEKPSKLNDDEYNLIKGHVYYTRRILESISDFGDITDWAADHHEQMSGEGYPYHRSEDQLTIGSRIMAVADVFTALTEDRPYRKGMDQNRVKQVIQEMADGNKLDQNITELLVHNIADLNTVRIENQQQESATYALLMQDLPEPTCA